MDNENNQLQNENENEIQKNNQNDIQIHTKKQPKRLAKRIGATVGVGVLSSMLTLGVVFNTDLLPNAAAQPQTEENGEKRVIPPVKQTASNENGSSLTDMIEQASSAIVGVVNYKGGADPFMQGSEQQESGTGSGVIYKIENSHAYIVTNNHVIEDAQKIDIVLENGERTSAELIGRDALTDLAVLKIDAEHATYALPFGDSDELRAGDPAVAIGNPLGLGFSGTVTKGIVSAKNRSINVNTSAGEWALDVIQTDAAINPGNSGGALLNSNGEVIGINSLKISKDGVEGIGFAIPSNDVLPLVEEMVQNGEIERPHLGISMVDLQQAPAQYKQYLPESVENGVIIANVDPQSAAGQAGLQPEDIITEMNGKPINNINELRKILYTESIIGEEISLTVFRGNEKQTLTLKLTPKA